MHGEIGRASIERRIEGWAWTWTGRDRFWVHPRRVAPGAVRGMFPSTCRDRRDLMCLLRRHMTVLAEVLVVVFTQVLP
jgi:hypothetical protein